AKRDRVVHFLFLRKNFWGKARKSFHTISTPNPKKAGQGGKSFQHLILKMEKMSFQHPKVWKSFQQGWKSQ
ncbi:MAG: hypothetical protein IJA82_03650, partial [Clostridia bacterium]|nr:hypothetical protein [Clostridia bacterium]